MARGLAAGFQVIQHGWKYASNMAGYASAAIRAPADYAAKAIACQFFYPLTSKAKHAELQREKNFYEKFHKGEDLPPLDNKKMIEAFHPPVDKHYEITLKDGKKITLTCRMRETKEEEDKRAPFYNLVFVAGNHSTRESEIAGLYPYMDSFLNKKGENLQGRMILITGYDVVDEKDQLYIPKTLDEAGFILKEALCGIRKECGVIDQIVGHSLGGILLGAAMEHFKDASLPYLPKHILFDRCPHSIYGACKNVHFACIPVGRILHPLASWLGWSFDLSDKVSKFYFKNKAYLQEFEHSLLVADVEQDHRFYNVQLGRAKKMKDLVKEGFAKRLKFDLAQQFVPEGAHHRLLASSLYGAYVIRGNKQLLQKTETLADGVMNISLKTILDEKMK
jgi:hypothetical protein